MLWCFKNVSSFFETIFLNFSVCLCLGAVCVCWGCVSVKPWKIYLKCRPGSSPQVLEEEVRGGAGEPAFLSICSRWCGAGISWVDGMRLCMPCLLSCIKPQAQGSAFHPSSEVPTSFCLGEVLPAVLSAWGTCSLDLHVAGFFLTVKYGLQWAQTPFPKFPLKKSAPFAPSSSSDTLFLSPPCPLIPLRLQIPPWEEMTRITSVSLTMVASLPRNSAWHTSGGWAVFE